MRDRSGCPGAAAEPGRARGRRGGRESAPSASHARVQAQANRRRCSRLPSEEAPGRLYSPREARRRDRPQRGCGGPRRRAARPGVPGDPASQLGRLPQAVERDDHPRRRGRRRSTRSSTSSARTATSRTQVVNPMPPIMEPGEFFMPYPLEVEVGGATVFVLPVERFERTREPDVGWTPPAIGSRATWTRTFTAEDVEAFAAISGDRNPLHFDADVRGPDAGRRADRPRRAHDRPVQRARRRGPARAGQRLPPPGVGLPGAGLHRRHGHRRGRGHRGPRRQADHAAALRRAPRRRDRGPSRRVPRLHDAPGCDPR